MLKCEKCGKEITCDCEINSYNKFDSKLCPFCFGDKYGGVPESNQFSSMNSFERQCQEVDFDNQTFQLS